MIMRDGCAIHRNTELALILATAMRGRLSAAQRAMLRDAAGKNGLAREWRGHPGDTRTRHSLENRGLLYALERRNCDGRGSYSFHLTEAGRLALSR